MWSEAMQETFRLIRRACAFCASALIFTSAAAAQVERGSDASGALESLLRRSPMQYEAEPSDESPLSLDMESGAAPRRWWPVLLSAAVPGLGEAVTGHWRGYPLLAADAGILAGAISKHNTGKDRETEYKAFADENYDEQIWFDHIQGGILNSSGASEFFEWECYSRRDCVPLWVSRAEDEREWYENIGKWDPFFFGWREYWPVTQGGDGYWPTSVAEQSEGTPLQRQYVAMRVASNDAFSTRDNLVSVSLLLRAFSVVQTAYLEGFIGGRFNAARADLEPGEFGFALDDGVSAFAAASPAAGSRFGVRMRF
jgi:hypothetical protein